jgi:Lrp/AsnC family transcriptional regulator for asnA, asnC and gidA
MLDELDFKLLACLQKDGRASFTVMAEQLDVSVGTVRARVNRLIESRTIQLIGRVEPEKVGFHSYACISLSVKPACKKEAVALAICDLPEVSFLAMTSGEFDLEVDVMCRDNQHLVDFVNTVSAMEGIEKTKTTMYFKVYKYAQPDLSLLR